VPLLGGRKGGKIGNAVTTRLEGSVKGKGKIEMYEGGRPIYGKMENKQLGTNEKNRTMEVTIDRGGKKKKAKNEETSLSPCKPSKNTRSTIKTINRDHRCARREGGEGEWGT